MNDPITLTRPVTILARVETGATGKFGGRTVAETGVQTVGEIQQRTAAETTGHVDLSDAGWLILLPADTVIDNGDAIVDGLDGHTYEVVGEPYRVRDPWTELEHHVEIAARRTAGPGAAS